MRASGSFGKAKQYDREDIVSALEALAMMNFEGCRRPGSEELLQPRSAGMLACRIRQQHHPGFMVLGLPSFEEAIGGG